MRKFWYLWLGLVLVAACGSTQDQEAVEAADPDLPLQVVWRWTGVEGGEPVPIDHPYRYTLEFLPDGRYSVRADCNSGSGTWSLSATTFALSGGPMTLAACEPGSLDRTFLELLSQVTAFTATEDRLLLTAGERRMVLETAPRADLPGTAWLVHAVNNGQGAVVSVLAETELTIAFSADGKVAGSAGCNRFHGTFTVDAQTVSFSPLATTRMTCMGDGVVEQEQAFLAALSSVATWEIRGRQAQLRTADGALAADLQSAVTGLAVIPTRQALPAGAMLSVQLQDVSRADAEAVVLGETLVPLDGQEIPVRFTVPFDPAEIDQGRSYGLRATVRAGDELLFTTTQHHAVLTRDGGQFGVDLQLQPVGE